MCEFRVSETGEKFRNEFRVNIREEEHMLAGRETTGLVKYSHAKENNVSNKSVKLNGL